MNKAIFIDTGAWFAGIAKNDQYHDRAMKHRNRLLKENARLITTNLVIHESTMLLERKVSKKKPSNFSKQYSKTRWSRLFTSMKIQSWKATRFIRSTKTRTSRLPTAFHSWSCMKQYQISRCFTFDHHFSTMGFDVEPL
jgi:predicted nucleic acid-binding protein